jgi:predicted DNA-binding transcriptional regulator AlpA
MTFHILPFNRLKTDKGITFSADHIRRLVRAGQFPSPFKIGSRNVWLEDEIDNFIAAKISARNVEAA